VTDDELNITVAAIKDIYNFIMKMNECDELFRAVSDVSTPELVPDSESKEGELVLRYEVTGSCRGCPEPLLFEDSINCDATSSRVLLDTASSSRLVFKEERELQTTTCTCVTGVVRRGVVQSKFIDGFDEWIEERKDEGELTNLRELLSLTKGGSFTTGSQAPSNSALASLDCSFPELTLY